MKRKKYYVKKKVLEINEGLSLVVVSKYYGDYSTNDVYLNKAFSDNKIGTYYNSQDSWEGINYNDFYVVFTYYDEISRSFMVKEIYDLARRSMVEGTQEELNELYISEFSNLMLTRRKY